MNQGPPFKGKTPNAAATEAIRQSESGENLTEYPTLQDLKTRFE